MNQNSKRKLSDYVLKKDVPYGASVKSMVLPEQPYPHGVNNLPKNAKNKATILPVQKRVCANDYLTQTLFHVKSICWKYPINTFHMK